MKFIKYFVVTVLFLGLVFSCKKDLKLPKKNTSITQVKEGGIVELDGKALLKLQKLDKKTFIINVSQPDSTERSCKQIKNYQHILARDIYKNPSVLPKDKTIILISKEGVESLKLANYLKDLGITVYNLTGGLKAYFEWKDYIETQHKIRPKNDEIFDGLEETDFGC